jgi:hypothetical protein
LLSSTGCFYATHQQLHKQDLGWRGMHILSVRLLHLATICEPAAAWPDSPASATDNVLPAPAAAADSAREKLKRIRRAIEHIGQAQIVGMLIQMPIVIANKADRTAADGVGLAVKDVNPVPCSTITIS